MRRDTVLTYLERCTKSSEQIERKTSGAGLGLYLVANHVSEFIVNLLPGVATEVLCVIDLQSSRQQLRHFGFYQETVTANQRVAPPTNRPKLLAPRKAQEVVSRAAPRLAAVTMGAAGLMLLAALFLVSWPYLAKLNRGSLSVQTVPSDATVYVNGVRRGVASPSLMIKGLAPDQPIVVSASREGFEDQREIVEIRPRKTLDLSMKLAPLRGQLQVTSTPAGAAVFVDDVDSGKKTPNNFNRSDSRPAIPSRPQAPRI